MAMASPALVTSTTTTTHAAPAQAFAPASSPASSTQRCLHPFALVGRRSSSSCKRAQRRVFRVSAAAAESGSVPPSIPKADIAPAKEAPPKPTLKKGQIVRVDKEKYLNSVERCASFCKLRHTDVLNEEIAMQYLSVGHPPYFTGLDYIYEDRGEILNTRFFDHGEYALISWAGIPTNPAWLPTYMLIPADRLSYKRQ